MTYELNVDEKTSIITQHIKNVEFRLYNFGLSLLEEQALSQPNSNRIDEINASIEEVNAQKSALITELESLA